MTNRKKSKLVCITTGAVLIPSIINRLIFKLAEDKSKDKRKEKFYSWQHGKIHYIVKGAGEPLLLLHGIGIGGSSFEWAKNIGALSKYYKVYALDFLGFGYSDKPKTTYTAYLYTQLINDFIKNVIKKPCYVAASNNAGAFTVMASAFEPQLYKKMLLISPTGIREQTASNNDFWKNKLMELPFIGTTIYNILCSKSNIKRFLEDSAYYDTDNVTDDVSGEYYYYSHLGGISNKYAIASFTSKYLNINIENTIKNIKIPLYIVWGDKNKLNPAANLDIIKNLNPDAYTCVFENTALIPHAENQRAFNNLCKEFFGC